MRFTSPDGRAAALACLLVSEEGKVAVIQAGRSWELLGVNELDDGTKSTPAIVDGSLYIRTYSALYRFQRKN